MNGTRELFLRKNETKWGLINMIGQLNKLLKEFSKLIDHRLARALNLVADSNDPAMANRLEEWCRELIVIFSHDARLMSELGEHLKKDQRAGGKENETR